ncbi:hypothetical protein [Brachybacterium endophyticum]|uniref:hypothetical protein n=1 Tax=Brachybacterium endophyticum TaxID=2182385 RepID=UPI001057F2FD|nr:hypothetical protein [Brachybacterium endophyticum]
MTPRRSDDPAAQARENEAPSASEYWDEARRRAARPAEIRRDPTSSDTNSRSEDDPVDPEDTDRCPTCGNGDTRS